jgi:hypothetical protein
MCGLQPLLMLGPAALCDLDSYRSDADDWPGTLAPQLDQYHCTPHSRPEMAHLRPLENVSGAAKIRGRALALHLCLQDFSGQADQPGPGNRRHAIGATSHLIPRFVQISIQSHSFHADAQRTF